MEMKIVPYKAAEAPQFNYDELKAGLQDRLARYEAAIYTDDQIRDAKADKAALNKLKKSMNDERIRMEREYMQPFAEFKSRVNELIAMIEKPISLIDGQVKDYEERRKAEKREQIEAYWAETGAPDWLAIVETTWFNASVPIKAIKAKIDAIIEQADKDLAVIRALPEFAFEAEEVYKHTHSLADAVAEAQRLSDMAKRKAEFEARKAAQEAEAAQRRAEAEAQRQAAQEAQKAAQEAQKPAPDAEAIPKTWLTFKALLSVDDALALREFFEARGIEFEAV